MHILSYNQIHVCIASIIGSVWVDMYLIGNIKIIGYYV